LTKHSQAIYHGARILTRTQVMNTSYVARILTQTPDMTWTLQYV